MTDISFLLWVIVAAAAAILVVSSILALPGAAAAGSGMNRGTKFFLVLLRLAIGWHFLIEASEKFHTPVWSSEGYLREATGPLAATFRDMAGDRVREQLTLAEGEDFPAALAPDWQAYYDGVVAFYAPDADTTKRLQAAFDQAKSTAATWIRQRKRKVRKITPDPSAEPLWVEATVAERMQDYDAVQEKFARVEKDLLPRYGEEAFPAWKAAKADVNKFRGWLKADLDLMTREMKRNLRTVLLDTALNSLPPEEKKRLDDAVFKARADFADKWAPGDAKKKRDQDIAKVKAEAAKKHAGKIPAAAQKELADKIEDLRVAFVHDYGRARESAQWEQDEALQEGLDDRILHAYRDAFFSLQQAKKYEELPPSTKKISATIIEEKQRPSWELLPHATQRPMAAFTHLDWSDTLVKYGLLVVGICLLTGLLTRTACVIGAGFLLMFFLAMPPLPGWPPSPRAEGHYLFLNKNIIEMLALLALATTRSGRWAGLDGLLQFLGPRRWRESPEPGTMG